MPYIGLCWALGSCILYAEAMYRIRVPDTLFLTWFNQGRQGFAQTFIKLLIGTEITHSILVSTNLDAIGN